MARLLADENVPRALVEALKSHGHDTATLDEGLLGTGVTDAELLALAGRDARAILTLNRRDFIRLHRERPDHAGIIVCTFDPDIVGQANRIHSALPAEGLPRGTLVRVNRPVR